MTNALPPHRWGVVASLAFLLGALCGYFAPGVGDPVNNGGGAEIGSHLPSRSTVGDAGTQADAKVPASGALAPASEAAGSPSPRDAVSSSGPSVGEAESGDFEPPVGDLQRLLDDLRECDASAQFDKRSYLGDRLTDLIRANPSVAPVVISAWDASDDPGFFEVLARSLADGLDDADKDWEADDPRFPGLMAIREQARSFFATALRTSASAAKRCSAIDVLGENWEPAGSALASADLIRTSAALDPDPEVRLAALYKLHPRKNPADGTLVRSMATGEADAGVRAAAVVTLGSRDHVEAETDRFLLDVFRTDREASVRERVVRVLLNGGTARRKSALPMFQDALAVPGMVSLRRSLLEAIVTIQKRDAIELLRQYQTDPEIGGDALDYLSILEEGTLHTMTIHHQKYLLDEQRRDRAGR